MIPSCSPLSVIDICFSDISFWRMLPRTYIIYIYIYIIYIHIYIIYSPEENKNISSCLTKVWICNRRLPHLHQSVHLLNLFFRRSSFFSSNNSIWNSSGALSVSMVWGAEINCNYFFIAWNSPIRSSNCFKMESKTTTNVVVGTSL